MSELAALLGSSKTLDPGCGLVEQGKAPGGASAIDQVTARQSWGSPEPGLSAAASCAPRRPSPDHPPAGGSRLVCNGFLLNLTSLGIIAVILLTLIPHQNVFISCFFLS